MEKLTKLVINSKSFDEKFEKADPMLKVSFGAKKMLYTPYEYNGKEEPLLFIKSKADSDAKLVTDYKMLFNNNRCQISVYAEKGQLKYVNVDKDDKNAEAFENVVTTLKDYVDTEKEVLTKIIADKEINPKAGSFKNFGKGFNVKAEENEEEEANDLTRIGDFVKLERAEGGKSKEKFPARLVVGPHAKVKDKVSLYYLENRHSGFENFDKEPKKCAENLEWIQSAGKVVSRVYITDKKNIELEYYTKNPAYQTKVGNGNVPQYILADKKIKVLGDVKEVKDFVRDTFGDYKVVEQPNKKAVKTAVISLISAVAAATLALSAYAYIGPNKNVEAQDLATSKVVKVIEDKELENKGSFNYFTDESGKTYAISAKENVNSVMKGIQTIKQSDVIKSWSGFGWARKVEYSKQTFSAYGVVVGTQLAKELVSKKIKLGTHLGEDGKITTDFIYPIVTAENENDRSQAMKDRDRFINEFVAKGYKKADAENFVKGYEEGFLTVTKNYVEQNDENEQIKAEEKVENDAKKIDYKSIVLKEEIAKKISSLVDKNIKSADIEIAYISNENQTILVLNNDGESLYKLQYKGAADIVKNEAGDITKTANEDLIEKVKAISEISIGTNAKNMFASDKNYYNSLEEELVSLGYDTIYLQNSNIQNENGGVSPIAYYVKDGEIVERELGTFYASKNSASFADVNAFALLRNDYKKIGYDQDLTNPTINYYDEETNYYVKTDVSAQKVVEGRTVGA